MPKLSVIFIAFCLLSYCPGNSQHIVVTSGNELINFGVLSIRSADGIAWSTWSLN